MAKKTKKPKKQEQFGASNQQRAKWAKATVDAFREISDAGEEEEDLVISDMLSDLMHYCHRKEIDFGVCVDRATGHFEEELVNPDCPDEEEQTSPVSLEELIFTEGHTASIERVAEFYRYAHGPDFDGFDDEDHHVQLIKKYLLSPEDKAMLVEIDCSIEDCLNGRVSGKYEQRVDAMFQRWNAKVKFKAFGDYYEDPDADID